MIVCSSFDRIYIYCRMDDCGKIKLLRKGLISHFLRKQNLYFDKSDGVQLWNKNYANLYRT